MAGFAFRYEVSNMGHVRRVTTQRGTFSGRHLRGGTGLDGAKVDLWRDGRRISMYIRDLIALAFIGPRPQGMVAVFRDGNPLNLTAANIRYGRKKPKRKDSRSCRRQPQRRRSRSMSRS